MGRWFATFLVVMVYACGSGGPTLSTGEAEGLIRNPKLGLVPPERPLFEVRDFEVTNVTPVNATAYRAEYEYSEVSKEQSLDNEHYFERYAIVLRREGEEWQADPATRELLGGEKRKRRQRN